MAATNKEIKILFSVLGGGSIEGQSGKTISGQINQIVKGIQSSNITKLRFDVDTESLKSAITTAKELNAAMKELATSAKSVNSAVGGVTGKGGGKASANKALNLQTAQLNKYSTVYKQFRRQQEEIAKAGLTNQYQSFLDKAYKGQFKSIAEMNNALAKLQSNFVKSGYATRNFAQESSESTRLATAQFNKYTSVYGQFQKHQAEIEKAGLTKQYQSFLDKAYKGQFSSIEQMNAELAKLQANFAKSGYASRNFAQEQKQNITANTQLLNKYASLYGKIMGAEGALKKNGLWGQSQTLMSQLKAGIGAPGGFASIEDAQRSIAKFKVACAEAGIDIESFGAKAKRVFARNFGTWITYGLISVGVRAIRETIQNVIKLDSAMAQLEIVTRASKDELAQFSKSAFDSAKRLGVAVTDIASATETFARLGYSLPDSEKLAELSLSMSNVAAIGEEDATTGLTAVMKAWGFAADEMESKADVIVKVGRKYAISTAEILEALENSAGAMAASGESFEHTVALLAAGNAITQNASKTGTAMRTMELRIRSTSAALEELEDLGEDTSELAEGFSKYRKEIKALSGVDIMQDEHTYRSVYDIMVDLAKVWEDLSDTQRSTILEDLGGKRGATVLGSIIQNLEDLQGAYADTKDAAGELSEAQEIYANTAQAKINDLKTSLMEMSTNLLSSDALKALVDSLKRIVEVLTAVTGFGNGFVVKSAAFIGIILMVSKLIVGLTAKITALGESTFFTTLKSEGLAVALTDLNGNGIKGFLLTIPKLIAGIKSFGLQTFIADVKAKGLAATLNAMNVNPVFLAIQAIALVGFGVKSLVDHNKKLKQEKLDREFKNLSDQAKKASEHVDALSKNIDDAKELSEKLQSVKGSYEQLPPVIEEINKKLGTHIETIDGTSKAYSEAKAALDKYLEAEEKQKDSNLRTAYQLERNVFDKTTPSDSDAIEASIDKMFGFIKEKYSEQMDAYTGPGGSEYVENAIKGLIAAGNSFGQIENFVTRELPKLQEYFEKRQAGVTGNFEEFEEATKQITRAIEIIDGNTDVATPNSELYDEVVRANHAMSYFRDAYKYLYDSTKALGLTTEGINQKVYEDGMENAVKAAILSIAESGDVDAYFKNIEKMSNASSDYVNTLYKSGSGFAWSDRVQNYGNLPVISGDKMIAAGWKNFDKSSYATTYSGGYTIGQNSKISFEISPILDKNTILSPKELDAFVAELEDQLKKMGVFDKIDKGDIPVDDSFGIILAKARELAESLYPNADISYNPILFGKPGEYDSAFTDVNNQLDTVKQKYIEIAQSIGLTSGASLEFVENLTESDLIGYLSNTNNYLKESVDTVKDYKNALSDVVDKSSSLVKMYESMRDNGKITVEQAYELISTQKDGYKYVTYENGAYKVSVDYLKTKFNANKQDTLMQIKGSQKSVEAELKFAKAVAATIDALIKKGHLTGVIAAGFTAASTAINKKISELESEAKGLNAQYNAINNMTLGSIASSSKASSSAKTAGEKAKESWDSALAAKKHELDMGRISEKEYYKWIQDNYKKYLGTYSETLDERRSIQEDYYDYLKGLYKEDLESQKDALNDKLNSVKDFYDKQRKILEDQYDDEDTKNKRKEYTDDLAKIDAEIERLRRDTSQAAQRRLAELEDERAEKEKDYADWEREQGKESALDELNKREEAETAKIQASIDDIDKKIDSMEGNTAKIYEVIKAWAKKNGYTVPAYASGTSNAFGGAAITQENGAELLGLNTGNGQFTYLTPGSKVWNASATKVLYDFANGPIAFLSQYARRLSGAVPEPNTNMVSVGDIIINGSADSSTVATLRKEREKIAYTILEQFKKLKT